MQNQNKMKYSKQLDHQSKRPNKRNKAWGQYLEIKKTNPTLNFEMYCKQLIEKKK